VKRNITELEKFENKLKSGKRKFHQTERMKIFKNFWFIMLLIIHRIIAIMISIPLLPWIIPAWIMLLCRKIVKGNPVWEKYEIFYKNSGPFVLYRFASGSRIIRNLPLFFLVITGRLALIGVSLKNYLDRERVLGDSFLYNNKPGLINLWFIRVSSRTNYEGHLQTENEFLHKSYPVKDLILLLHFIPAVLYSQKELEYHEKIEIFDIGIDNISMEETVKLFESTIAANQRKRIYFVNPDCLNKSLIDGEYKRILQERSDLVLADGIGVVIASKILRTPLKQNVNGTDLLPFLCELCVKNNYSLFLLGAKPGIVDKMQIKLETKYPGIKIVGKMHGYFDRETENDKIISSIKKSRAKILLVAFGAPGQEKWISTNFAQLPEVNLVLGVGGLFDFYSDTKKRAPRWMRQVGFEWIFRLGLEPGRMWKRYILGNPHFLAQVVKYMVTRKYR